MTKQEALKDLEVKIQSVNVWKRIVDLAVEEGDANLFHFMKVLGDVTKDLYKSFHFFKRYICLGWDE